MELLPLMLEDDREGAWSCGLEGVTGVGVSLEGLAN